LENVTETDQPEQRATHPFEEGLIMVYSIMDGSLKPTLNRQNYALILPVKLPFGAAMFICQGTDIAITPAIGDAVDLMPGHGCLRCHRVTDRVIFAKWITLLLKTERAEGSEADWQRIYQFYIEKGWRPFWTTQNLCRRLNIKAEDMIDVENALERSILKPVLKSLGASFTQRTLPR
jgi:hypothetical protein